MTYGSGHLSIRGDDDGNVMALCYFWCRAPSRRQPLNQIKSRLLPQSASDPRSPVRILITSSTGRTKIFPSPISPVRALCIIVSTTLSTSVSSTTIISSTFGSRSIWYSRPRYISVIPFCLPRPFTSVIVMLWCPTSSSADLTTSSLVRRNSATIFFTYTSRYT